MAELHGAGTIFNSSSTGASTGWTQLNPKAGTVTFQARTTGSSVGALVSSVVQIQASNDGVTPLATVLGTITLSSAASPASDGFTTDAAWKFVRANQTSISTSTGSKTSVIANAQVRS